MDWFDVLLCGMTVAAQAVVQIVFSFRFSGKNVRLLPLALYLLVLCAIQLSIPTAKLAVPLALFALYAVNRLLLKNSRAISSVAAVLAVYVTQLSFGLVNSLENLTFAALIGQQALMRVMILAATGLAFALCWMCCRQIARRFPVDGGGQHLWLLLPPSLFYFVVEFYILETAYSGADSQVETGEPLALLALQLLGLAALFSTLLACRRVCDGLRAKSALDLLKQEARAQEAYVAQAQTRYEQTRSFRHDLKNHLSVLNGLIKSGKWEQAGRYLDELDYTTRELSFPVHTSNPVIDVLLGDKLALAEAAGISWEAAVSLPPEGIDTLDLCVIFANALDNAIAACKGLGEGRRIRVADKRQGDFYMLEFENTCAGGPQPLVGIGLSNIRTAAEKYGGTMMVEKKDAIFRLNVLLNISLHPESISEQTP